MVRPQTRRQPWKGAHVWVAKAAGSDLPSRAILQMVSAKCLSEESILPRSPEAQILQTLSGESIGLSIPST